MRSVLGAWALVIAVGSPALADPAAVYNGALSRAQAIARVTTQGFGVRAAQADYGAAQARSATARSALLPQVGLSATATDANVPQLGMPTARQSYLSTYASLPLFNLSLSNAGRAAGIAALAAADDVAAARNDAALAAVQAYDRASLAAAVAAARHASVADQQGNVALITFMVRAGKEARYQLLRARADLARARQAAEDADAERDEALNDLKLLLDFDPSSDLQLSDALTPSALADAFAAVADRARRQRPELASAKTRLEAAAASLHQAEAAFAPVALLSAQTYNGTSSPPLGRAGSQVSAQVSIPLVDGGARSAAVAQAKSDLEKAQIEVDRRDLMVQTDVANAWRELAAARINLETAQAAVADAQENLRVARLRRRAGKAVEPEILDALSVAASAREAALRALARADLAVAGVHHAAGELP